MVPVHGLCNLPRALEQREAPGVVQGLQKSHLIMKSEDSFYPTEGQEGGDCKGKSYQVQGSCSRASEVGSGRKLKTSIKQPQIRHSALSCSRRVPAAG